MKRRIMIGALLALLAMAGGARVTVSERVRFTNMQALPEDFLTVGLVCDDDRPVIFGHRRALLSRSTEARILRWDAEHKVLAPSYSATDCRFLDWDVSQDGILTALIASTNGDLKLLRSSDRGQSWNATATAPDGAFGVAFLDARSGFAWASDFAYHTTDGGATWESKEFVGLFRRGSPWPVVDSSNRLWTVETPDHSVDAGSSLVALDATLTSQIVATTPDLINRIAASESHIWLLGRKGGHGTAVISGVSLRDHRLFPIVELNEDLPIDLAIRTPRMAVVLSETGHLASKRYVLLSNDPQRPDWIKLEIENDSLQQICVDAKGHLWAAGRKWLWRAEAQR